MKLQISFTLACLLVLVACSNKSKEAADAGSGESETATPVEVETVKCETVHRFITAEAVLYPLRQANIMPKLSAPVQRFLVNRGDHVQQGQLLAVLEGRDLIAAAHESEGLYHQAQATYQTTTAATMPDDLTKAKTDVLSARQTLDAATKVFESRQVLLREGALAQKLVDDAKVAMVQAQSQFETSQQHLKLLQTVSQVEQLKGAQAQVEAAKAHYENAEAQVSYAEVRSPMSGVVSDRPISIGEMASSSSALISIIDISQVVARASVPTQEAAAMKVGDRATISGPGGELTGKVTVVSPAVDPNTTTVGIWVQAANPGERLTLGVAVQIAVDAEQIKRAVVVPATALLSSDEGGEKVIVAGSDSLAHERKVKVGVREREQAQILEGLKEGEQVITVGALGLDDKAKIKISKPESKEGADEKGSGETKGQGQQ